jgi:hypothetical protein
MLEYTVGAKATTIVAVVNVSMAAVVSDQMTFSNRMSE